MKIQVCVGSSCYLRGATGVIERLQDLIRHHGVEREVELEGSFCMERCTDGVTLGVADEYLTGVRPEDLPGLFREHVLPAVESQRRDGR